MKVIEGENNIFFDIDGTLVLYQVAHSKNMVELDYYGEKRVLIPHEQHVSFLKACKARGFNIFLWSNNGYRWAKEAAIKLGLEPYVDFVLSKPQKIVDDEKVSRWLKTIFIPSE